MNLRPSLTPPTCSRRSATAALVATLTFLACAPLEKAAGDTALPRIKLAASVEFPTEILRLNSQRLHDRVVTSSITHASGHVVELLYDAQEGAQIRDPLSRRIVWVPKSKLALMLPVEPSTAQTRSDDEPYFRPYLIDTVRPIRFPLRRHDGRFFGETTIPAGEKVRITAENGPYLRAETRDLAGWVKKNALENQSDRALTALANVPPKPETRTVLDPTPPAPAIPAPVSVPFETSKSHNYIEVVPLTITAEVLGRQKYPMPGQKGGFWSTEVSPVDFALAWGPFVQSGKIQARMGYRQACFRFSDPLANVYSGNFHIYVDDPEVRRQLLAVRVGDVVRLQGALIRLEQPRGKANPGDTTTTGAFCYSMLCRSVEKLPSTVASTH